MGLDFIGELVNDLGGQLSNLSNEAVLFLGLIGLGYLIRAVQFIPNRFIPLITFAVAVAGQVVMGDPGKVDPTTNSPQVRLAGVGVVIWLAAWLSYELAIQRAERWLRDKMGKGDTRFFEKPPPGQSPPNTP